MTDSSEKDDPLSPEAREIPKRSRDVLDELPAVTEILSSGSTEALADFVNGDNDQRARQATARLRRQSS